MKDINHLKKITPFSVNELKNKPVFKSGNMFIEAYPLGEKELLLPAKKKCKKKISHNEIKKIKSALIELEVSGSIESFIYSLNKIESIDDKLKNILIESSLGDSELMNKYLFSENRAVGENVVWLAKTNNDKYVWMIGKIDKIETFIKKIRLLLEKHSTLYNTTTDKIPPRVRFINSLFTSSWQKTKTNKTNSDSFSQDLSIFQINYNGENIINDVDQNFAINLKRVVKNSLTAYNIANKVIEGTNFNNFINCYLIPNVEFLSALHIELHNIGHFIGSFPFSKKPRDIFIYEPIEEFRACLAGLTLLSESLGKNNELVKIFSLHILLTRFFYYGLRSFKVKNKDFSNIREIIVACLFLSQINKIELNKDFNEVHEILIKSFYELNDFENSALKYGKNTLQIIAKKYISKAFPNGKYSLNDILMYEKSIKVKIKL